MITHLHVGGAVALGFDEGGEHLLVVSHSGRGVFKLGTWERVARDIALAYPENSFVEGIGPISGRVRVVEKNYETDELEAMSPDGVYGFVYESGAIAVSRAAPNLSLQRTREDAGR